MSNWNLQFFTHHLQRIVIAWYTNMSFVIDKTVTDKAPKKTVISQFTGNNSIGIYKMRGRLFVELTTYR